MIKNFLPGLIIVSILLTALLPTKFAQGQSQTNPEPQSGYQIVLDLEFEDADDLNYLGGDLTTKADEVLADGMLKTGLETKFGLLHDTGVYVRFMIDGSACFSTIHAAGYEACNGIIPNLEVMDHSNMTRLQEEHGILKLQSNRWYAQYSWYEIEEVNRKTELVFYSMFWDEEDSANYVVYKSIIPHTDSDREIFFDRHQFFFIVWSGKINIDSFKVVRDDHLGFLSDYAEGFKENSASIEEFFQQPFEPDTDSSPGTSTEMGFSDFYAGISKMIDAIATVTSREGVEFRWSIETNKDRTGIFLNAHHRSENDFWIRVNIQNSPGGSEQELLDYIYNQYRRVIIHTQAPQVGDLSLSFEAQPSEMYVFVINGLMVEIYAPMVYKGNPQDFNPEYMASMAAAIAGSIPENFLLPEKIPVPDRWQEDPDLLEKGAFLNDNNHIDFFVNKWVPSLQIVTYFDLEDRVATITGVTDMYKLGIGHQEIRIDEEYPDQFESAWLLVDGKILVTVAKRYEKVEQQ